MNSSKNIEKIKKQKKTIIIIMLISTLIVALYFLFTLIDFDKLFSNDLPADTNKYPIYFYDEDLSKNIFQDEIYMGYDRTINLQKGAVKITIDENDAVTSGPAVNLIYNMIGYIISGNHEGYNSCFSENYYRYASPVKKFTQQKIYNIVITEVSVTNETDENGESYIRHYYTLEYMIRHNNGSLRNDMGSDCIKTQHLYISENNSSGEALIDNLFVLEYVER